MTPPTFQTIPELFFKKIDKYRGHNKVAFAFKPSSTEPYEPIHWEKVEQDTYKMLSFLLKQGIKKGDRVALISENRYEWVVVDLASQLIGAVNVSLYTTIPSNQVEFIIRDSGAELFFVSSGIQLKKALDVKANYDSLKTIVAFNKPNKKEWLEPEYVLLYEDIMANEVEDLPALKDEARSLAANIEKGDLCTLIYTSGTTGNPKGAMLSHWNICSNINGVLKHIPEFDLIDRSLSFLPICHSFERMGGYYTMMAIGAEIYFAESVDTVSKNLLEANPTILISVPRLFEKIYSAIKKNIDQGSGTKKAIFNWAVKVGADYAAGKRGLISVQKNIADKLVFDKLKERTGGRIKFFISGGAALPPEIGQFFLSAGFHVLEGYGLTETSPVMNANQVGQEIIGTVGRSIPGVKVGIMNLDSQEIIAVLDGDDIDDKLNSESGEILCKGPNVMIGYWKNKEATEEVIDPDGWFHTGDVGKIINGRLKITDRIKHMIVNAGGKNIYPGPIEDQIKSHPLIDQVMLVGEAQKYMAALIVPDFEALTDFLKDKGVDISEPKEMVEHEATLAEFNKYMKSFSRGLASHERIRDFKLLTETFTVENGLLTPTMKIKRKKATQTYKELIDKIFEEE
jgi:long-chain acyl-CoA synthetase